MTDEPEYDEEERAEAEALARALDGAPASRAIEDAVDAAEVVRVLKAPVLSDERADAVLEITEQRIAAARRRSRTRIAALGAAGGVLAIAAAALLMVRAPKNEPSVAAAPSAETALREVKAAAPAMAPGTAAEGAARAAGSQPVSNATRARLRDAQLAWLAARERSVEVEIQLGGALRAYRDEQLAQLEQRYVR